MKSGLTALRLCGAVVACALGAEASGTAAWEMNTWSDFIRGRFQGVSLSRDGRLTLAPRLETVWASGEPVVWSAVRAPDGALYAATGHRGRVYRIDPAGKSAVLWTAGQPEVFALALDRKGALYAAGSPDGKVYRIENGKAAPYFSPQARYVWSLVVAPDGALYVGTGDQGRIYRVTAPGQGELWYETGQSHVTSLAVDGQGRLLAGTEPNGILYRVSAKDKAFALYDANLPEIRAIVPAADGAIYAAALGGSVAKRAQGALQPAQAGTGGVTVTAAPTTITVEAQAGPGAEIKPPADSKTQPQQPAAVPQVTTQFTPAFDMTGVEKSAVYRINPDNTVETLWTSKEENVYDLLESAGQLLIATDAHGRVYSLAPDRKVTLLVETNEAEATRLLDSGRGVMAATGNMGRIYRLGEGAGPSGTYESPVYDAGTAARWGSLSWRARVTEGAALKFQTRSGNSARPDRSWSDWSAPVAQPKGSPIASPNARYIQWRAEFSGAGRAAPLLDGVALAYLPQNSPPVVKSINVTTQSSSVAARPVPPAQGPTAPYSITVSDTGEASSTTAPGTPTTVLTRSVTPQINITWQAEDPDGDRMVYTVWFRGEDEREWKLLKGGVRENTLTVDADALADGRYFFRVLVSDADVNPPGMARTAELVSAPVLIDNTPPAVLLGPVRREGAAVTVEFEAADGASPLRRCEYSLDAAAWVPIEAADGVVDSEREKFLLRLANVPAGEHLLVLRAVDSSNNSGLAKTVLR